MHRGREDIHAMRNREIDEASGRRGMTTADPCPASFRLLFSVRLLFVFCFSSVFLLFFLHLHTSSSVPATPAERAMSLLYRSSKVTPWTLGGRSKSSENESFFFLFFLFAFLLPFPFLFPVPSVCLLLYLSCIFVYFL